MSHLPVPPDDDEAAGDDEHVDAELLANLADEMAAAPPDAPVQRRIKRQLLQRIAAVSTPRHLTLQPGPEGWQPFADGVQIKVLHENAGVMSYFLRLAPGAEVPAHRHPVDEECVVLEGEVQIGTLRVGAGGFHLGRRGVLHDTLRSEGGAMIFLRGAVPEASLAI